MRFRDGRRKRDVPPSLAFLRPEAVAEEATAWGRWRDLLLSHRFRLRVLFGLDVIGAGGPGLLMLVVPETADKWFFAGGLVPDAGAAVLGCVWLALGLLAVAGLFRPITFSPVLLLQFAYKLVWLLAVAAPAVAAGESVPWLLTTVFAFWVVAVGVCLPWRALFGRRYDDPYGVRNLG